MGKKSSDMEIKVDVVGIDFCIKCSGFPQDLEIQEKWGLFQLLNMEF